GQRRPIHLQRMEAEDLLAAAWPSLAACQDNAGPGPITVPDHVLVRQTVEDCLTEALDADGLVGLLESLESGRLGVRLVESSEPSPLAHGILTGKPYTFLDGAPLEERRTRAVGVPRGLGVLGPDGLPPGLPVDATELAPFEPEAVGEVLDQVRPSPRTADELHDLLLSLVWTRPVPEWSGLFEELAADGRVQKVGGGWAATERAEAATAAWRSLTDPGVESDQAVADCVGGHLELCGPVTPGELVADGPLAGGPLRGAPLGEARARSGLARLEADGSAIELPDGRICARHLLVRMHAASRSRRRGYVEPSSIADFVRFLACWQHVAEGTRLEGRSGLRAVVQQLQGLEIPAGDWERHVLPARVARYDPRWLDELCLAGEIAWGRLTPRPEQDPRSEGDGGRVEAGPTRAHSAGVGPGGAPEGDPGGTAASAARRGSTTPSPATPLSLVLREDLAWVLAAVRADQEPLEPEAGASADVLSALRARGACFRADLPRAAGRLPDEVDEGLWDLVARGIVTADAFSAVRSLLAGRRSPRPVAGRRRPTRRGALGPRRAPVGSGTGEGRWSLLPGPDAASAGPQGGPPDEELAEAVAWQLLDR
ncbi:MAG TPA: hypothetical protein VKW77_06670, partial [Acidimicrobiales bacterium]|nr:hypothetical protein [Acidimicrobiales bacterium]